MMFLTDDGGRDHVLCIWKHLSTTMLHHKLGDEHEGGWVVEHIGYRYPLLNLPFGGTRFLGDIISVL